MIHEAVFLQTTQVATIERFLAGTTDTHVPEQGRNSSARSQQWSHRKGIRGNVGEAKHQHRSEVAVRIGIGGNDDEGHDFVEPPIVTDSPRHHTCVAPRAFFACSFFTVSVSRLAMANLRTVPWFVDPSLPSIRCDHRLWTSLPCAWSYSVPNSHFSHSFSLDCLLTEQERERRSMRQDSTFSGRFPLMGFVSRINFIIVPLLELFKRETNSK